MGALFIAALYVPSASADDQYPLEERFMRATVGQDAHMLLRHRNSDDIWDRFEMVDNSQAPWVHVGNVSGRGWHLYGTAPATPTGTGRGFYDKEPAVTVAIIKNTGEVIHTQAFIKVRDPLDVKLATRKMTYGQENGNSFPGQDPSAPWGSARAVAFGGHSEPGYGGDQTFYMDSTSYLWGSAPDWLSINSTSGFFKGIPDELGTFHVSTRVTDIFGGAARRDLEIEVVPPALRFTSGPEQSATATGSVYNVDHVAEGGYGDVTWSIDGSLPSGLALVPNKRTAKIVGTPLVPGTYSFGLTVADKAPMGYEQSTSREVTITVGAVATATGDGLPVPCPAIVHPRVCDLT